MGLERPLDQAAWAAAVEPDRLRKALHDTEAQLAEERRRAEEQRRGVEAQLAVEKARAEQRRLKEAQLVQQRTRAEEQWRIAEEEKEVLQASNTELQASNAALLAELAAARASLEQRSCEDTAPLAAENQVLREELALVQAEAELAADVMREDSERRIAQLAAELPQALSNGMGACTAGAARFAGRHGRALDLVAALWGEAEARCSARASFLAWRRCAVEEAACRFGESMQRQHEVALAQTEERLLQMEEAQQTIQATAMRASARAEAAEDAVDRVLAQNNASSTTSGAFPQLPNGCVDHPGDEHDAADKEIDLVRTLEGERLEAERRSVRLQDQLAQVRADLRACHDERDGLWERLQDAATDAAATKHHFTDGAHEQLDRLRDGTTNRRARDSKLRLEMVAGRTMKQLEALRGLAPVSELEQRLFSALFEIGGLCGGVEAADLDTMPAAPATPAPPTHRASRPSMPLLGGMAVAAPLPAGLQGTTQTLPHTGIGQPGTLSAGQPQTSPPRVSSGVAHPMRRSLSPLKNRQEPRAPRASLTRGRSVGLLHQVAGPGAGQAMRARHASQGPGPPASVRLL